MMDKQPFRPPSPDASGDEYDPLVLSLTMLTAAREAKLTGATALEWVRLAVEWGVQTRIETLLAARELAPGSPIAVSPEGTAGQMDSLFYQDLRELDPNATAALAAIAARGGTPVLFLKTLPYLVLELGPRGWA